MFDDMNTDNIFEPLQQDDFDLEANVQPHWKVSKLMEAMKQKGINMTKQQEAMAKAASENPKYLGEQMAKLHGNADMDLFQFDEDGKLIKKDILTPEEKATNDSDKTSQSIFA